MHKCIASRIHVAWVVSMISKLPRNHFEGDQILPKIIFCIEFLGTSRTALADIEAV